MAGRKLIVTISGPRNTGGDILFRDFREFCKTLSACLHLVEEKVSPSKKHIRYLVSDLKSGSATMTLEPIPPKDAPNIADEIINTFVHTVGELQSGRTVDARFSTDDLQIFRRLGEPLTGRLSEVKIAGTKLTTRFIANIDDILGTAIPSEGSVTGRLDRLNVHLRREFVIYPPLEGFSVTCVFAEEMFDQVQAAIRQTVTVFGKLSFRPDRPYPDRIIVQTIEIHPADDDLPKLRDLKGVFGKFEDGMTAVKFVRSLRND